MGHAVESYASGGTAVLGSKALASPVLDQQQQFPHDRRGPKASSSPGSGDAVGVMAEGPQVQSATTSGAADQDAASVAEDDMESQLGE